MKRDQERAEATTPLIKLSKSDVSAIVVGLRWSVMGILLGIVVLLAAAFPH
jgi:hypothetical protein